MRKPLTQSSGLLSSIDESSYVAGTMKRTVYRSLAARGLAKKMGVPDPVVAVKLRASEVISDLPGPPFMLDTASVRSALGIREVRIVGRSSLDGRVFPTESGFVVELNRRMSYERRAFTLAHELAHTFFAETVTNMERSPARFENESLDAKEEESLCDIAAAEMLMPAAALIRDRGLCPPAKLRHPSNAFFRAVLESDLSVQSLLKLARTFRTSLTATARRIAELGLWSCHIGFWEAQGQSSAEFAAGFASNRDLWVPKGRIAEDNIVARSLDTAEAVEGWDDIGLQTDTQDGWGNVFVQALRLSGSRQIVSLAIVGQDAVRKSRNRSAAGEGDRTNGQGRLFE